MTGVIYASYSSDNQREDSIEGQIHESVKADIDPRFAALVKDGFLPLAEACKRLNISESTMLEAMK